MNYNYNINDENCADKRGANHVKEKINKLLKIFNVESIHAQTAIESFFNSVGINIRILTLVDNFDSRVIINNINFDRLNNNPRIISEKTILEFLEDSK
ncbi:MAG: hypothetical protein A2491_13255 [Bacteroidetes bacterium RIFOXYC12_FULL_35_7]|nr:MAG: hypothetical protein A2491_13255 [Bacteroidetes bacterium RIFOXYC12_FULL_35_7]